ncbi:MAG TPA: thiamine pyrophosphate-dependent enzyme [Acidobacteriaceae bacterium]|nr:thiamine pyrophosphate-dependent enzyme [Acidobacteriaceae bacterium]
MAIQERSAVSSAAANGKHGHSLISDEKFHQLYTLALDCQIAAQDRMSALSGHEAALAAVSADLRPEDTLVSEHAWPLIASIGVTIPSDGHAHPQPIVAMSERVVDALSVAVAHRMRRNQRVTVLLFPDKWGGDVLREARAVASSAKLPIIFVERADQGASTTRRAKAENGSAAGDLISIPVDAQDVIAMYRVAHESIARARHGSGPTRIVCLSLNAAGERGPQSNAVANLEKWLVARGLPVEQWRRDILAACASRNVTEHEDGREAIPQSAA